MDIEHLKISELRLYSKYSLTLTQKEFMMYKALLGDPIGYARRESLEDRTLRRTTFKNVSKAFGND